MPSDMSDAASSPRPGPKARRAVLHISSAANPKIKEVRKLYEARSRRRLERTVVEGMRGCRDLLRGGAAVLYVLREENRAAAIDDEARRVGVPCLVVASALFRQIASTVHSQGVLAVVEARFGDMGGLLDEIAGRPPPVRIVVLDRIQDPGNLGTIVRTAVAFGFAAGIVCRGTTDPWGPKAVRGSAGSVFHLPLACTGELAELASHLRERGIALCVTAAAGGRVIATWSPPARLALVISNEGAGVSPAAVSDADTTLRIPLPGPVESLNAAAAFAIIAHHLSRCDGATG